jgi:hypothetical protein
MSDFWIHPVLFLPKPENTGMLTTDAEKPAVRLTKNNETEPLFTVGEPPLNDGRRQKPHIPAKSPQHKERYRGAYKVTRDCPEGLINFLIFS